ncbi:striated muscle-specific serine/threonine-protein kinase [Lampris incognitus]|uniref:striated muscle-specific serine/threonine-protein kinase n=1 Tax=Lampris incognitus TaxID=2546036 RepID=UPI0024B540D5|nr:striated muscle-specific serine/threonine-protein kinase [Lampris incognitus]
MRKAEVQMTLKKSADEGVEHGAAPPSSIIPPKRSKANLDQPVQDLSMPDYPTPSPPVFVRKMRNAAVGTGCDIRLKVSVAGNPQPSLYWYHNDDLLNMDNQEYGGLWIRDCKPSDAGLYTCIANNHLGETRSSAVLAVLDLGEDSETTEDEDGDQFETKEDDGDLEDQGVHTAMNKSADDDNTAQGYEDNATRSQSDDFSRESPPQVLPPPSPRLIKRPSISPMPSRSGSTTPLSMRKKVVAPTDYQDTVPAEYEEKVKQPKPLSQSSTQDSRPQTPVSEYSRKEFSTRPSPKLTRASSKVFEKVRGLEERRRSLEIPEGSISGRSWAGFNRAPSVDSDDGGSRLGISRESSREDLREALKEDAAERRSMFRQRAASLEEKPRYSQKVQDIENKFTEELQRIKKLVGKPHMKKSFSTEQLTLRGRQRQPFRKLEPIPPQVIQKLQEREHAQWEKEQREKKQSKDSSPRKLPQFAPQQLVGQQLTQESSKSQPQELARTSITNVMASSLGEGAVTPESMQLSDLPGQRYVREISRASPVRELIQRSSSPVTTHLQRAESPSRNIVEMTLRKVERRPPSPLVQRVSRMQESPHIQESPVQTSTKDETSGRKTPIEVALRKVENRPESPLVQRKPTIVQELPAQPPLKSPKLIPVAPMEEKMEIESPEPASKLSIPTIIVEDEQKDEGVPMVTNNTQQITRAKDGQPQKTKGKNRRTRPMSPELESSDDSYVSAGEDPMEAPVFEFPLQDTVAYAGVDVLLKCIIAGTPLPEVTWKKDNTVITGSADFVVKVEGERHSLLIKSAKPSDGGKYFVTAVNEVGKDTSSATLIIKGDFVQEPKGNLGVPMDISSPITSDEEYLSPLEEGMDFGGPEPRKITDIRFKEPPSFLVTMSDQAVIEGQEVNMSVRISGQPKPLLYWLRDRVTVKTGPRHIVRETESGSFEMVIKSAVRSDSGVYICKIINEYGTKQCEGKLVVKASPVEPGLAVIRPVKDITAKAGETVLFECHVIGPKDTDVDWLADGKLIQPALLNCKMHFDGRKCRLLLNSVHEDDSGTYMCKLSTAKEEVTSCGQLKVIPSVEPLFTRKLDVLEVIEGRNARFDCKVSGTPPPRVTWSHFDHPLMESEDIRILQEGGRYSLIISHVTNEDEGFYTVTARNSHGEAESAAELYVQEPRPAISSQMAKLEKMPSIPEEPEVPENEVERLTMPDFIKPLYDLDVIEGKEAVLKCKVAGLPYPTIVWFHNGKRIESTEDRKMTQFRDVHSLVIRSVCHAHGGVYKSVISNKVGKATCYAHLYITDILPDPPDGAPVIEAITGKTITLSWRKPRRLDASIEPSSLMYAIQQQALGSIQWTIIASSLRQTTYTITTLTKGVRYVFRVLTITSKAFSKPSPATDPVQLLNRGPYLQEAPSIIDKPDIVYVIENQPVTISVTLNHVSATIIWKRRGVVLTSKPNLYEMTMPDDDQHTLKLLRVKTADVGEMMCVASNKYGSDTCNFIIEMAAPPTFETIMEDLDVRVGETPRFAVVVEGKPIPDILWFKNDTLLSESSHYTFVYDDNECSLVVLNTQPEDSGVYTCTARNLAGSVSCKAELTVHQAKIKDEPMEDEETILRKMRRLTDYFDIHKEIGRGAFSYVKRVTQKVGKMEYAAKFISARAKRKASALREMNMLSKLDHERVLYFHDAFEKKNAVIIITEICHEELLNRFIKKSTVMESDIRSCMRQLLEGVDYLHHQNTIHLDIKPDNILMADAHGDQIRICDFGNALDITPDETQYCKYGTPEFVAPEIVNQTPVSKATDIWPIGVIAYLCLTGVSPFAGENDRSSVLNIRNYNVAFEESMFADLSREAKGFIIKLLVADSLRPDTQECLRHPWFKTLSKGKAISTEALKKFVSRRKWQRSLISYKSKMVMRSIPELLNDSSSHISIAVPRHLKEGSPLPSSSSDSDEDIDELPFIPMPLTMEFSGSRISLNDIQSNEQETGKENGTTDWSGSAGQAQEAMECEPSGTEKEGGESAGKGRLRKRSTQENDKGSSDEESPAELLQRSELSKRPLRRGSSMESDKPEGGRRRGELRRGGSADSALLLRITPDEGAEEGTPEDGRRVLKKAMSMELPRRSASPGAPKMSQEDYALKLELMRQRLLRGGSVDNKMSGLRGPLLETLRMGDEKRVSSSERISRAPRLGPPPLTRAASSDSPRDDVPKQKVLRKSASFSQGDSEPIPLHRRSGAPLEIPLAQIEERRLKEAISMSALTEQIKLDSRPVTPREPSPKPPTPESAVQESPTKMESEDKLMDKETRQDEIISEKIDSLTTDSNFDERSSTSGFSEKDMSISEEPILESERVDHREPSPPLGVQSSMAEEKIQEDKEVMTEEVESKTISDAEMKANESEEIVEEKLHEEVNKPAKSSDMTITSSTAIATPVQQYSKTPENVFSTYVTPSLPARVVLPDGRTSAYASIMQTIMVPSLQPLHEPPLGPSTPVPIPSSSASPISTQTSVPPSASVPTPANISKPVSLSTTEHPAVYSRVASPELMAKEPSPPIMQSSAQRALSAGGNLKDITSEEVFEARFKKRESSLTRGIKFLSRSKNEDKSQAASSDSTESGEEIYRPGPIGAPLEIAPRRLEEKSKSVQDLREAQKDQGFMRRLSMRLKRTPSAERKEEKTIEEDAVPSRRRLSWTLGRRGSQDKKEVEMTRMDGGAEVKPEQDEKDIKKPSESPVLTMRRKIESTVAGISTRIRSYSEERKVSEEKDTKRTPILSMLRRSTSESRGMKSMSVPQNQLASQAGNGASSESLDSMSSLKSETSKGVESERRSRWDRWGLTRGRRDKTVSQPDIPSAISRENSSLRSRQYSKLASDFHPVFHIKLRDHVLLEGDPVTLSCLPAGSPHPHITWMKDKKPLEIDARINMISCPDGRQLLMIMQTTKKDAGLYECVATNPLASVSSCCTISLARLPNRPGTPEIPQKYKNTALVLWRPSDTMAPCTYSLERRTEGLCRREACDCENTWLIVATGVADCYYNVVDLPSGGSFRFRVACVNKAGQGPYSNLSKVACLDDSVPEKSSATVVVKTVPAAAPAPPVVMMSSMTVPAIKHAPNKPTASSAAQPVAPTMSTPAPALSVAKSVSPTLIKPIVQTTPSPPVPSPPISTVPSQQVPTQTPAPAQATPTKAKTTLNINVGKPQPAKLAPPPVVLPKPQSPVNIVPPMAKTPPEPVPPPVPAIGKPISAVPMYAPTMTARVTPPSPATHAPATSVSAAIPVVSPPVVLVSSLTPVVQGGDSRSTPSGRITPSGRTTPSGRRTPLGRPGEGTLRQGVPQKPYTFMDEKARGRFGVIRECRENATGNLFMAKIVPYEVDSKQAVLQEYDILKSLHHEKIMALHEAYVTPRYLVLISENCSGKELLYSLIDRFRYSEDDVVTYVVQILHGLDYLHTRRILHLDIKPENVVVTYMNVIKIIDFGSAQNFNPLFLKQFSPPVGTLEYMSPEMLKGDVVGPPADIWSVGVLTFIMLSGRPAFMENDPMETETRILAAKLDLSKLYQNVSQSASLFLKKIICSYPWGRPSIKDCFNNSWLQDAYLMRLRRQTLTFTTTRLKEFLADEQRRRAGEATKHKVLLRSYQSSPQTPTSPTTANFPPSFTAPVTQ